MIRRALLCTLTAFALMACKDEPKAGGDKTENKAEATKANQPAKKPDPKPAPKAAPEPAAAAKTAEQPASQPTVKAAAVGEKVQIKVDENGYTPGEVKAKADAPLTLVFTRTTDKGCGEELVFPKHDIKKDLPLNTPVEITITPKSDGPIAFTCGMGMYRGSVVAVQ